jgi:hypothetical protein
VVYPADYNSLDYSLQAIAAFAVIRASRILRIASDWSALGGVFSKTTLARFFAASLIFPYR